MEQRHPAGRPNAEGHVRETFGRYQLLGLLGQGGMGRLYIAERRGIQGFVKVVALKRILPHLADSAQLREMFLNEARIAAKLEHPNIVATYELGEFEGTYFISMEYLPGEDFSAIIARCQGSRRIPIEIATALAQQAAQGLHHAHEARDEQGRPIGLVHRDVNPRNVFLTYHGVVKLLDFGVVRGREGQRTLPGAFKGKYGYCAPEQIEGGQVDRRTDVFCLGIVLWECLTGARLFDASTDAKTIDAVRSRRVEPPSVLRPEIPRALDEIVLRALARDPDRRFQSAHDMSEELDAFLLERDTRPTSKSVGRWLESMFGSERAALKKGISQGGSVEGTLERLAALDAPRTTGGTGPGSSGGESKVRPRALWSTSFGTTESITNPGARPSSMARSIQPATTLGGAVGAIPATGSVSPPSSPGPRRRGATGPILAGSLLLVGAVALVAVRGTSRDADGRSGAPPSSSTRTTATLRLASQPPGAQIFVDGSPSGLKTPALLAGLSVGTTISIRLDKAGYEPVREQVKVEEGRSRTLTFTLHGAFGTVRLVGAPRHAVAYLDDRVVDAGKPFPAAAGPHRLRVELEETALISKAIDVRAGAETVLDLDRERSHP